MKKTYSARSALFSDSPIASVDRDEFGRAEFAKMLAESIAHVPADDGFVYALNAPWGSGKTSTLNFVREHLTQNPEGEQWTRNLSSSNSTRGGFPAAIRWRTNSSINSEARWPNRGREVRED